MPMFRKRTFASFNTNRIGASNGTRAFKRRRFTSTRRRRINRRGGRRTLDYTSLNTRGHAVGFRGRKTSRRAFKSHLWNSTLFKAHYRSILTLTDTFTSFANTNLGQVSFFNMYRTVGAEPFWTVAGGAQELDNGDGVPEFGDEIVLRGGIFRINIHNGSANDLRIKIWRFTTGNNPDLTLIPSDLAAQDQMWDPSVIPDFYTQVGRPFMTREVVIEGGNSYTFSTRFKSQKIDQNAYENNSRAPYVMIMAGNQGAQVGNAYTISRGYNVTFSGDVSALAP